MIGPLDGEKGIRVIRVSFLTLIAVGLVMVQETYVALPSQDVAIVTWGFILAMFAPWAIASFEAARRTRRGSLGLFAGVWSSAVCMILTVSFGFGQLLTSLDRLQRHDVGSPDFLRRGWSDLRAFAIADVFEAGSWHLLIGPAVALCLGGVAALAARLPSWYIAGERGRGPQA